MGAYADLASLVALQFKVGGFALARNRPVHSFLFGRRSSHVAEGDWTSKSCGATCSATMCAVSTGASLHEAANPMSGFTPRNVIDRQCWWWTNESTCSSAHAAP